MHLRTGNFLTSGPDLQFRLPMRLRFLFYCIYCSFRRLRNRAVTWLIYSVGHMWQFLPKAQITGFVRRKIMNMRKKWKQAREDIN